MAFWWKKSRMIYYPAEKLLNSSEHFFLARTLYTVAINIICYVEYKSRDLQKNHSLCCLHKPSQVYRSSALFAINRMKIAMKNLHWRCQKAMDFIFIDLEDIYKTESMNYGVLTLMGHVSMKFGCETDKFNISVIWSSYCRLKQRARDLYVSVKTNKEKVRVLHLPKWNEFERINHKLSKSKMKNWSA